MFNMECKLILQSPLVKIFPEEGPLKREYRRFSALRGETASFQAAYKGNNPHLNELIVCVDTPLVPYMRIRSVELMPSTYPCHTVTDDGYLRTAPGLFPDYLGELPGGALYEDTNNAPSGIPYKAVNDAQGNTPCEAVNDAPGDTPCGSLYETSNMMFRGRALLPAGQWRSLWIDIDVPADYPKGLYSINISLIDSNGERLCSATAELDVIGATLPAQKLIHTEWFHGDCLSDFYGVPVLSESWWGIAASFIKTAVKRGMNMILTPAFTPPLDTAVGGERTTVQLVDVSVENGVYAFRFDNLHRWIELCESLGIRYFEMSHLFTQWGAKAAPKIMARVDGADRRIFGWDTPATGGEYTRFLSRYLPALTTRLREWGVAGRTFFHISDEPSYAQLNDYVAAKNSIIEYLKDFEIIDALSDFEFYKTGAVRRPIPASNHIQVFIDNNVSDLWTYYCTGQYLNVSNRFFALPSYRNRIIGIQLYKYKIQGFLHWGYNFYNSRNSVRHINPFAITDGGYAFPSGDPFMVYPDENGAPGESVRIMVFHEALQDLRALEYLETLAGRDFVLWFIEESADAPITFSEYPKSDEYILDLREKVNREIAKRTS